MQSRTALVTGLTGQDGSYLAELLLAHGYRVCGLVRPDRPHGARTLPPALQGRVELHRADLLDGPALAEVVRLVRPDEVYNLAAVTFVPASVREPLAVYEFNVLSAARLLDAVRSECPEARYFQAGSSEMFGNAAASPQNEDTPFRPRSPYGAAKVAVHHLAAAYRAGFGLFACTGILFNHESPRRGPEFVTRKITRGAARVRLGLDTELRLGSLDARRDWGFAGDYVRAMWLMLQQDRPDDYVIGTGVAHTVEEFVALAFARVGLDWRQHVVIDPQFVRPPEAVPLIADASRARERLGWRPELPFADLVHQMVDADLADLTAAARSGTRHAC
jgi:GDPmannose 4,6-dehydratase